MEKTMDKIIALAKARGFVYPGSEIYGGLANTWDYGNLGVELKNNVKRAWWQKFIQESPYNVGVDCAILMNPQTWVASGHLGSFSDPLMDCKECHERFRADKIIEDFSQENGIELESSVDGWSQEEMMNFIKNNLKYPQQARETGTQGKVFVSFVVERDGSLTDVKVLRDIGSGCGEEAVRVVKSMPKWKPAKQRGKPVRMQFNLPVAFTLAG